MEDNQFVICSTVSIEEFKPGRVPQSNIDGLVDVLSRLDISKTLSVLLNKVQFATKSRADDALKRAKVVIRSKYIALAKCEFTTRTINDADKKYVGTRVWRVL